jgi:hypothetical protein
MRNIEAASSLSFSGQLNAKVPMPIEPPEIPPATPGTPTEPPPGIPPGNPQPDIVPPVREPDAPPQPDELPPRIPEEIPPRGPNGPHTPNPATDKNSSQHHT